MNKYTYITLLLLLTITLSGCYRDNLCFMHPDGATIELKIDWSYSKLKPNSATAVIYKDGAYFRTEVFSVYPPVRKVIHLPEGNYSFVVFDEQISDYETSISFQGINKWETFEAKSIDDYIANLLSKAPTKSLKSDVDTLAVDRVINFQVTPEMIHNVHNDPTSLEQVGVYESISHTITFLPKRVFTITQIVLNIKNGAGYYFTQRNPATLHGIAESYFLGLDKYSEHSVSHPVRFEQLATRSQSDTVYYSASLHLVGLTDYLDPDIPVGTFNYYLTLPFTYSGGIIQKEINLNEEAKEFYHKHESEHDLPYHYLYIEVEIDLPPLVLVGGLEANVEDWTDVDIPLDGPQRLQFLSNNGSNEVFWWNNTPGIVVNLPIPLFSPVEGVTFREWNTEPDGSGISFIPGDQFEMKRGGFILYAIWDKTDLPHQTLYFIANNGINEQVTTTRRPGELIPIPTNAFSAPAGKTFNEWNTKRDGTGVRYLPFDPFRVKPEDTLFYAIWK